MELEKSGCGCKMNNEYFGIIGYADDIVLMAPDKETLNRMLEICNKYARDHCLIFNAAKSQFIIFGDHTEKETIMFNGVTLECVDKVKYLGSTICAPYGCIDSQCVLFEYAVKVNAVNNVFKNLPFDIRLKMSTCFAGSLYGAELVKLSEFFLTRLDVTWRKGVRKTISIPYRSCSKVLPVLTGNFGLRESLFYKCLNFYKRMCNSDEKKYINVTNYIKTGSQSNLAENFRYLCNFMQCYQCNMDFLNGKKKHQLKEMFLKKDVLNEETDRLAVFTREILSERDYIKMFFTVKECNYILNEILVCN